MTHEPGMSDHLISHIGRFRDEAWDTAVLRRTKLCLLDSIACYSAGRTLPHFAPSASVARNLFGMASGGSASISQMSPFAMAYTYGQAANALDYDDTLFGHPGSPVVGAVLSTAVHHRLPADRLLRGIAAGYEAHLTLCAAGAASRERAAMVRSVGVWDTVAASIGIAVALRFDDAMLERVIGLAVAHSILPYTAKWYQRPVPALKNNMGWIAAGAVLSVSLATAGLSGVTKPLDGDTGMWQMAGSDRWSLRNELFERPAVLRVGFKHYPACWFLQEHLKSFAGLLKSLAPGDEISKIEVASPPEIEKFCPSTLTGTADVGFSLPATFRLLAAGVEPGPLWDFYDEPGMKPAFRYERSERREIRVRTRAGGDLKAVVGTDDPLDLAAVGLDEHGVIEKHKRLTDPILHREAFAAFEPEYSCPTDAVPDRLYGTISRMLESAPTCASHSRTSH